MILLGEKKMEDSVYSRILFVQKEERGTYLFAHKGIK